MITAINSTSVRAFSWKRVLLSGVVLALASCASTKGSDESDSAFEETPTAEGSESTETASAEATTQEEAASNVASGPYSGSSRVEVASVPFERDGRWLNSFYFVRANGETWESLSKTLYGKEDVAALLQQWNPQSPTLEVGSLVYYNSPARPKDQSNMKPFIEDFGGSFESLTVQAGDSLSTLALKKYGNAQLWRELSAVNPELANPDLISVGQVLRAQPDNFDTSSVLSGLKEQFNAAASAAPQVTEQPADVGQPAQPDPAAQAADQAMAAPTEQSPADTNVAASTDAPATAEDDVVVDEEDSEVEEAPATGSFVSKLMGGGSSNLLLGGLALLIVALSIIVINRRRAAAKAQSEDMNFQNLSNQG